MICKKRKLHTENSLIAEDDNTVRPKNIEELFEDVRSTFLVLLDIYILILGEWLICRLMFCLHMFFSSGHSCRSCNSWSNATNNKGFWQSRGFYAIFIKGMANNY